MKFIGHRFSGIGPNENTLDSLQKVLTEKPNGVECDIYFTKDGVAVVTHAKKLKDAEKTIAEMTFGEFQNHQNDIPEKKRVPTLEQVLSKCAMYHKENPEFTINIENKDPHLEQHINQLKDLINRHDSDGKMAYFSCFQEDSLNTLRNTLPNHKCEMLFSASTSGLARGLGPGKANRALPAKLLPAKRASALGLILKAKNKLTGKKDFTPSTFDQVSSVKDNKNIDAWNIEGFGLSRSVIELAIQEDKPINIWFINERPPHENLGILKRIMKWKDKCPELDLNFITDYVTEMKVFTESWKKIEKQTLKQAIFFLEGQKLEISPQNAKERE